MNTVADFIGIENAQRLQAEVHAAREDAACNEEGVVEKLERMRESRRGRAWLEAHPEARWDDIAQAKV